MVAPACVLTGANTFTGVLDTSNYMMTYTAQADFTASAWCNPDNLSTTWTYQYEDQASTDYIVLSPTYPADLAATGTASGTKTMQESDFSVVNTFTVDYDSTDFTSQADAQNVSTSSFSHEQTCRPKFAQSPEMVNINLESDSTLTVEFSLEFATTGFENCVDLVAKVEIYNDDTDLLVYTSGMNSTHAADYQEVLGQVAA